MTTSRTLSPVRMPCQAGERLFFLDWLRIIAFIVLVLFHVGMYYVTWDFHVKSPFASPVLEPWMTLSAPWRMSLLFMVSGAATALLLRQHSVNRMMRQRSRQLLLPLLCGVVVVVPPQAYFEVVQKLHYAGSYGEFLGLYFRGYKGFCEGKRCLILPTWNHLWFLAYLWTYTLLAWAVLRLWPHALQVLARVVRTLCDGLGWVVVPLVWLALIRVTLHTRFPATYALAHDWYSHALYFFMFCWGAGLALTPIGWSCFARWRWAALAMALLLWVSLGSVSAPSVARPIMVGGLQWSALVAAFGFARHHLNVDHPWRQHLSEAVFPVYVLHQTIIIALSQWLLPWGWRPWQEGPVLVLATLVLSYLGYRLARPVALLRPWFGLRPADAKVR